MATVRWRGDAPAVSQVCRATPAHVEVGDTFKLSINGKSVSYIAAAATVADVTAGLTAAWNASQVPEFLEVGATDMSTYILLTGDRPGVPFTVAASTVDGGGTNDQTLGVTTDLPAAGPNHWDTPANWSTGSLPADGDDVYIENSAVSILYGVDQSSVALASLNIAQSFSGYLGLPPNNPAGYVEYRDQYLAIQAAQVVIGQGDGSGSGRIKIDTGSAQTVFNLVNSGSPAAGSNAAVQWKGNHSANVVNVVKGSLGIAIAAGESALLDTLRVGFSTNIAGDALVECGAGTTLDTLEQSGGQVTVASDLTTVNKTAGDLDVLNGSITSLNLDGGTVRFASTSTIGSASIGENATLDFSRDMRARTVAACSLYSGGRLSDPFKTVTFSTGIHLVRAPLSAVTLDIGVDRTLTLS